MMPYTTHVQDNRLTGFRITPDLTQQALKDSMDRFLKAFYKSPGCSKPSFQDFLPEGYYIYYPYPFSEPAPQKPKCDCGAAKTYGEDTNLHTDYCSTRKK